MNLYVAVTMYEDKIFGKCAESILKNINYLMLKGIKVTPFFLSELYIDRARNMCVDNFLKTDCTDLLFVDADLSFEEDAMYKIIQHDKPIIAGSYRLKQIVEQHPTMIDWDRENNNCKEEETGLVWVKSAPTGFMRIQRNVFEKMKDYYNMKPDRWGVLHFFETGMKVFNDGQWWGEDTSFCKKWTDMDNDVMVEPNITFTHTGNRDYTGNFHEHLMSRSVNDIKDEKSYIEKFSTDIAMPNHEVEVVKKLASEVSSIVEVGCWKGNTTKSLLDVCDNVYAVDHFNGSPGDVSGDIAKKHDIYQDFYNNVGGHPNLTILRGSSVDMAKQFNGNKVDMVFIDAGHEYDEVKEDIDAWLPKTTKILAGHDYCKEFPGVIKAVNEFAENRDVNVIGSVWWCNL